MGRVCLRIFLSAVLSLHEGIYSFCKLVGEEPLSRGRQSLVDVLEDFDNGSAFAGASRPFQSPALNVQSDRVRAQAPSGACDPLKHVSGPKVDVLADLNKIILEPGKVGGLATKTLPQGHQN